MIKLLKNAAFVATVCVGFGAQAATVTEEYDVQTTLNKLGVEIGLGWLGSLGSGLSASFSVQDEGIFQVFDDDTATLSATFFNNNDSSTGFDVVLNMDSTYPNNQAPEFKGAFADVADPGNVRFFDPESGTVSGFGAALAGLDLEIGRFPGFDPANPNPTDPDDEITAFQFGGGVPIPEVRGVNQHNADFGFSVWLQAISVTNNTCAICSNPEIANIVGEQFDIVGNLQEVSAVPLPAGSLLLLSGLGAMGVVRRRRKA